MSLFWNWGSKTLLRRCMPLYSSSSTRAINSSTLSSSLTTSSIIPTSASPTSLSSLHLYMALRFKGGVKTVSGAKKRFRVRGSGSIKRGKAGKSHNTGYLKRQRANRLGHSTGIQGKKIEQRVRKLLGVFNG
mmetsp:Transcript_8806/g.18281  ORF Transcript_8806/g.18281 Transcript_8806/m.18281 type:complete len:132 (+) Transcript_8806:79-474(+)